MKYAAPLFSAFLFCTTTALAADHLKPEDSIYSGGSFEPGYDQAMAASFEDAFADDVLDRVIVQPSFETEFAAGVKEDKGRYRIFYQEVSEQLWQYTVLDLMKKGQITSVGDNGKSTTQDDIAKLEKSLPPDPKDVKVNRCEYGIDPAFGVKLAGAWADVLLETRYSEKLTLGLDGTIFHFYARRDNQRMAGQTWSPNSDTKPGMLADIAYGLRDLCKTKDASHLQKLEALTDKLVSKLKAETPSESHD